MWKRLLKIGKSRLFCLLFLLFLLLPLFHSSYAAEPAEMVTMPRVQYNQLVTTIRMYENKSTMLEMKLETLQLNSTEALKALIEAQNQLAEVKATLAITKKSLQNVEISLVTANEILNRQKLQLDRLTKLINDLSDDVKLAKRQRNAWVAIGVPVSFLLGRILNK